MSRVETPAGALHYDIWHMVFYQVASQDARMYHLLLDQEDSDRSNGVDTQRDRHLLSPEFRTWS
ncbi:hypothetical protein ACEPPN_004806 [Leptodophora sp. 'Broadleaf-Isolate-01']